MQVEALLGAFAQEGEGGQVHPEAEHADHDDGHRRDHLVFREPLGRLDEDEGGDAEEQDGVGEGGEDLEAVEPEGPLRMGLHRGGGADGGQGHGEAECVRRHVARVGQQRQGAGDQAGHQLDDEERDHEHQGSAEGTTVARPGSVLR